MTSSSGRGGRSVSRQRAEAGGEWGGHPEPSLANLPSGARLQIAASAVERELLRGPSMPKCQSGKAKQAPKYRKQQK